MIGDSNFRCINERGVMATVTAITGGRIGNIANQVEDEDLSAIENVVLSSGQNCINDIDKLDTKDWEIRTLGEIKQLEKTVSDLMSEGKNVFIMGLSPTPAASSTKQRQTGRKFINDQLSELVQNAISNKTSGMAAYIDENDGNFNAATDFADERHLTPLAVERMLRKLDEILPESQKLRNNMLTERQTCKPYKGCYGTYPVGCSYCTRKNHDELACRLKIQHQQEENTKKRNLSSESQGSSGTKQAAKKQR